MDAIQSAGGGGGPAPFLLKTYEMVDDSSTDEIVSWSAGKNSFIVWNPPELARLLLPNYFKHNNFSSFIRQLNTYGFHKIDPEKWEFANDDFVKDQKHLLKNIHRKKPIHSHSQPPASVIDPERAALDEEIERLSREKAALEAKLLRSKQQKSAAKLQLEELTNQVDGMEQRQDKLLAYLEKAVQKPSFLEKLAEKIESSDIPPYNKKRRLPQPEHSKLPTEDPHLDNSSSCRADSGNLFQQDFSNKLRLELSPAVSDMNLVSHSIQSSNEDGVTSKMNQSEGDKKDAQKITEGLLFSPDIVELSDTGSFPRREAVNENAKVHSLPQNLACSEDTDGSISCHLNLTLASSPLPVHKVLYQSKNIQKGQESEKFLEFNSHAKELNLSDKNTKTTEVVTDHQASKARVNDVFWEQFLTERPGSSDNEEASSTYRENSYEESDDRRTGHMISRKTKNIEQLTL